VPQGERRPGGVMTSLPTPVEPVACWLPGGPPNETERPRAEAPRGGHEPELAPWCPDPSSDSTVP
jgi:hypothetical protein